jgi:hypothetical protein
VATPAPKLGLNRREKVLGVAVDLVEVPVSSDAEGMMGNDLHAREKSLHMQRDDIL